MIEVKTARNRSEIPVFVSSNEIAASNYFRDSFHIYRLFQFETKPGMYSLRGRVADSCELRATDYLAAPRG